MVYNNFSNKFYTVKLKFEYEQVFFRIYAKN